MGIFAWANRRKAYSFLESADEPEHHQLRSNPSVSRLNVFWVLFSGASLLLSFAAGRLSAEFGSPVFPMNGTEILPLQTSPQVFIYNRTFSEDSVKTTAAWEALFPPQKGYFTHPTIAPQRSTFSVYHYLHCLNGIRMGYWVLHSMASAGEVLDETALPMMVSPPHIRHCVDLLRQALMCRPDLTIEVKDVDAGGVHGFGETHQCQDWSELRDWTGRWEGKRNPQQARQG